MKLRFTDFVLLAGLLLVSSMLRAALLPGIQVTAGKTFLIDTAMNIERVSIAEPSIAEAVPVSPRTVMVNGKLPGETSLVVWLSDGSRTEYDVSVHVGELRLNSVREQMEHEFGASVKVVAEGTSVFLTGTVKNLFASQRAVSIVESLGKVVNLLNVEAPERETQILLKVRFANVDRSKASELGINFVGAPQGFPFSVKTGRFTGGSVALARENPLVSLSDSLNVLFWDPQINVGAALRALASKNILQILAEPNLLAMNGHEASFVAGGEFPFPTIQGGASGVGQITIQFRQFGVQIRFLPTITPRGTIRLHVAPEVSALDYANALTVQGNTIPALSTRRVNTEIELEDGQTFAIAGLLDQRTTEQLSRIPGLSDIPILGKLFQSKSITSSNSELIIIVTPELVSPIADPKDVPELERPLKFMEGQGIMSTPPRTPNADVTGPVSVKPHRSELSVQEMVQLQSDLNRGLGAGGGDGAARRATGTGGSMGAGDTGAAAAPAFSMAPPDAAPQKGAGPR